MSEVRRLLLAIGNAEIENKIREISDVIICDSDDDMDIITDVLDYEEIDFVIINTVLSERKSIKLANVSKEKGAKVIAIVESHQNKELIASLVGFGVRAIIDFTELKKIPHYISHYPDKFDFTKLQEQTKNTKAAELTVERFNFFKGKIFIGVFDICSGAGATATAISIAESLARSGCKTICIALDQKDDFKYLDQKRCKAEFLIPDEIGSINFEFLYRNSDYEFIIFDLGKIYEISSEGEFISLNVSKNILSEFLRCNFKIALTFSDVWHVDKLKYFTLNDELQYEIENGQFNVMVSGMDEDDAIKKYNRVDIYKRDNLEQFISDFKESVGIKDETIIAEKQEKKGFGLWKWTRRKRNEEQYI